MDIHRVIQNDWGAAFEELAVWDQKGEAYARCRVLLMTNKKKETYRENTKRNKLKLVICNFVFCKLRSFIFVIFSLSSEF